MVCCLHALVCDPIIITIFLHAVSPEGSVVVTPLDVITSFNDNATLVCNAMGGPNNSFQWEINGNLTSTGSEINLIGIDGSYGGKYTCTVSNAAGTDFASTTLYVAPYIVTPLEKETLTINGSNVILLCNASGFPTPSISWINTKGLEVSRTALLQFNPAIFGDEGVYCCIAESVINQSHLNATVETILIGTCSA